MVAVRYAAVDVRRWKRLEKASVGRRLLPHNTCLFAMVGPPRDRGRTVCDDVEEGARLS